MSKKINGKIAQIAILWVGTAIAAMILWPIFDWLWALIFTHSEFHYSVNEHIIQPLIFATFLVIITCILQAFTKNKKK